MEAKEDKKLKKAYEKLEYISGDEKLRRLAELRRKLILDQNTGLRAEREIGRKEGILEGRQEGILEGIRKGEKNQKEKMAKKLLKLEIPIEEIMEITELSKEEIKRLKEQI